jgi:4-oxalocrotonate tautomerase
MPLVQIKVIKDVFDAGEKQEMIRKVTDTMASIEGESLREYTVVMVEEVESGEWGIGGNCLTARDVNNLRATAAARA